MLGMAMASGYIEARRSLFLFDFVKLALSGASLSDLVTFGSSDAQTGKRAAILLIIDTINGIISFLKEGLLCQAGENFVKALRVKIFSALLRQEIRFYDQNSFDDLKSLLEADTEAVGRFFTSTVPEFLDSIIRILSQLYVIWGHSYKMAIVTLSSFALMMEIARIKRLLSQVRAKKAEEEEKEADNSTEVLMNVKTVRAFCREETEIQRYAECTIQKKHVLEYIRENFASSFWWALYKCYWLMNLWYGGRLVISAEIPRDEMQTLVEISTTVYDAINFFLFQLDELDDFQEPSQNIFALLDRKPAVDLDQGLVLPTPLRGEIVFENVRFAYTPGKDVLQGMNLAIPAGLSTALVGAAGGGKSTLLALIQRFYEPTEGRILVDGRDLREYNPRWFARQVAAVSSHPVLFNASIEENIRYAKADATHEDVVRVCQQALIDDDIERLPDKYETNALQLPNSLKQRIAIARALLKDPRIVLVDEPTFAMDAKNEEEVQRSLEMLMRGRTCVIIASRLSTLRRCDSVAYIENGRVLENGSHAELMLRKGGYANLISMQLQLNFDDANVQLPSVETADIRRAVAKLESACTSRADDPALREALRVLQEAANVLIMERARLVEIERRQRQGRPDTLSQSFSSSPSAPTGSSGTAATLRRESAAGRLAAGTVNRVRSMARESLRSSK